MLMGNKFINKRTVIHDSYFFKESYQHHTIRPLFFLSFFRSNNFRDHYFTSVSWFKGGVAVNWMNRGQNASIVSECRAPAWKCLEVRRRMENRAKNFAFRTFPPWLLGLL